MLTRREKIQQQARALKGTSGRRGLPAEIVRAMWRDYQRLRSTAAVAREWGRSPQSVWELLAGRGYPLRADSRALLNNRPVSERVKFEGRIFTPSKRGYLRATSGPREPLHHAIWAKHFGPVPPGCWVSFKNGNFSDYRLKNLFMGTPAEVTGHHQRRLHPATACLSPFERHEHQKKNSLRYWRKRKAAWIAAGLRSDGKPRAESLAGQRLALLISGSCAARLLHSPDKHSPVSTR